jgi:hypothetical protein
MAKRVRSSRSSGSWQAGKSGNPKGRPPDGESWAARIKSLSNMTGEELAAFVGRQAAGFKPLGDVTVKDAVILSVFKSLIDYPDARLFTAIMERAEGKLAQTVKHDVGDELLRLMREYGLSEEDVKNDPVASELFRLAGIPVAVGTGAAGGTGPTESEA